MLDAGSSGTRLHVYRWLKSDAARQGLDALPALESKKKWTTKVKPGISTFGDKPKQVGPDYLAELFHKAKEIVPGHQAERTPLFLLATAGVRLLPDAQREHLLHEICQYAQKYTYFAVPDCQLHIQVIPGNVEGLYGWIAANYLLGGFDHRDTKITNHQTFGFLDMGGASAQIAFAPNSVETERHANDLTLLRLRTLDGEAKEYRVFTTTWLGFGVNEARRRYVEGLQTHQTNLTTKVMLDPCLPPGLSVTPSGDVFLPDSKTVDAGKVPIVKGTGDFQTCLEKTLPLLDKDHICEDEPCLIGGVHVPTIDFDVNHFVGVSEYWHTTHGIFEADAKDKTYDFNTYQNRVSTFCTRDWSDIQKDIDKHKWGEKVDERTAVEVCFKASYLINILHEGIGIPRVGLEPTPDTARNASSKILDGAKDLKPPSFQAIHKIDSTEVSWTLGQMLLFACSQIPPSHKNGVDAVGYGSNGGKDDFQSPAVLQVANPPTSSRRMPGLVIFLLILCFAGFLARRRRILDLFSKPKDDRGTYERMEGLDDIELEVAPDAEYSGSRSASRSNGRETPRWRSGSSEKILRGDSKTGSFDNLPQYAAR